jgi:nicotinamide-nucleotide amidase
MADPDPIVARLIDAGATVATAESITAGRLAARLTDGAGSSAAYVGGVVTYATEVKVSVLGVPEALVDDHGVISEECARSMAENVRTMMGTTYGVSTTGVAGPDTQEGQPVGTVFVGVAGPDGTDVRRLALDGGRAEIQKAAVAEALSALGVMMDAVARSSAGRGTEHPGLG